MDLAIVELRPNVCEEDAVELLRCEIRCNAIGLGSARLAITFTEAGAAKRFARLCHQKSSKRLSAVFIRDEVEEGMAPHTSCRTSLFRT